MGKDKSVAMKQQKGSADGKLVQEKIDASIMIGKNISHYRILEKLGEGGMGVVYKAEDNKLQRTVALKFLSATYSKYSDEMQRLVREARAAASLSHPNIGSIYELGEDEDQTFIVMEYIEGETLKDLMKREGPLSSERAFEIAIAVAAGLGKAHEKDIVHRDIKSENIMISKDGFVKIMDFGLVKLSGNVQLTKTGDTVGTVAYMSPEQVENENVDHRSDIYSLGVVLYEMLSGTLPFHADNEIGYIYSILNASPPPLESWNVNVSIEVQTIVDKMLAKDPEKRYHHANEFTEEFRQISARQHPGKPFMTRLKKFLPAIYSKYSGERKRLVREERVAASSNHPNIGSIYELEGDEDHTFGMEAEALKYLKGKTIVKGLKSSAPKLIILAVLWGIVYFGGISTWTSTAFKDTETLVGMGYLDFIIILIVGLFVIKGLLRGFFREILGLVALFVALFFATKYMSNTAVWVDKFFGIPPGLATPLGFLPLFLAIVLGFLILAIILQKVAQYYLLGWFERLAGGVVGFLKGITIVSLLTLSISVIPFGNSLIPGRSESKLFEPAKGFAPYMFNLLTEIIPGSKSGLCRIKRKFG